MKKAMGKEQPKSMKVLKPTRVGRDIVLTSIKVYSSGERTDKVRLTPDIQRKLRACKSYEQAKAILRPLAGPTGLRVDSASAKQNLANHDRKRQHLYNPALEAVGLGRLKRTYGTKEQAPKKAKRASAKKTTKQPVAA